MPLQNADLLFVPASSQRLSQLISTSTASHFKVSYSHVAIVQHCHNRDFVIHATEHGGCIRQTLAQFVKEQKRPIDVYRIKQSLHNKALVINRALAALGAPYNPSFRSEQPGYYCSELVCHAFAKEGIFQLKPMTFGPDGSVLPQWRAYYQRLHLTIPNLALGSSPNSLLKQITLSYIKTI